MRASPPGKRTEMVRAVGIRIGLAGKKESLCQERKKSRGPVGKEPARWPEKDKKATAHPLKERRAERFSDREIERLMTMVRR